MQTHVMVTTTCKESLRTIICKDAKLEDYSLAVDKNHTQGRAPGWAKLSSTENKDGSINLHWDPNTKMLLCRIVNKGKGKPENVLGDLLRYLMARYRSKIRAINIIPG